MQKMGKFLLKTRNFVRTLLVGSHKNPTKIYEAPEVSDLENLSRMSRVKFFNIIVNNRSKDFIYEQEVQTSDVIRFHEMLKCFSFN